MNRILPGALASVGLFALCGTLLASTYHFQLSKSLPEAGSAVSSPAAIDLWFSQVPQEKATSIRLIGPDEEAIETGSVVQDREDGKHQSVSIDEALEAGEYTVAWRSMAADGHVVRGDFTFSVTAQSQQ